MNDVPTMIACPTPPSHHSQHHYHHRRDASDTSCMMDYDDDCNVSMLSLGAPFNHTPQQMQGHRIHPLAPGDYAPPTPTPTHTTPQSTSSPPSSTNNNMQHQASVSPTPTSNSSGGRRSPMTSSSSSNVRVNVGGESFSFSQATLQQPLFAGLPWKTDVEGVHHLSEVSPAVFEVLLDYTLFGTLPAYDTLCDEEFREFETIALSILGRQRMDKSSAVTPNKKNSAAAPTGSSNQNSTNPASPRSGTQQHQHHYHDLMRLIEHFDRKDSYLNKELRRTTAPRRNGDSNYFMVNAEQQASPSVTRFLGAICSVLPSRRRPLAAANTNHNAHGNSPTTTTKDTCSTLSPDAAAAKRLKLTHGQWCASSQDVM